MVQENTVYPWTIQGHKIFRVLLVVQWIAAIGIGLYTGEVIPAMLLGSAIVALPLFLSFTQTNKRISAHAIAIGVQLLTALHIHQSAGLVEVHFEIFATLAVLAIFRDWTVVVSAVVVIAVHHILFYVLQLNSVGVYIFDANNINFGILVLHAFFAVAQGSILVFMSYNAFQEGAGAIKLSNAIKSIVGEREQLDLTIQIDKKYPILQPIANLVSKLKELISVTNKTAMEVSHASAQILTATQELTGSISKRSDEVSSIASASNSISKKIQETSVLTEDASDKSNETRSRSESTFTSVTNTNEIIGSLRSTLTLAANNSQELSQWSASIANAMNAITSISDQTNLLALNAAIESARAGEHGRGFAVVAEEVRNLAIKSKQNAEEISEVTSKLLENTDSTLDSMNYCVDLVDKAVSASDAAALDMQSIIGSIKTVADNISTVSSAAEYQDSTSRMIAESTEDVQKGMQGEVLISQQLEAQVSALSSLSEQMKQATLRFKVN